jgi:hypothetical protein
VRVWRQWLTGWWGGGQAGAEKLAKALGRSAPPGESRAERAERDRALRGLFASLTNVNARLALLHKALIKYQETTRFAPHAAAAGGDVGGGVAEGMYTFAAPARAMPVPRTCLRMPPMARPRNVA